MKRSEFLIYNEEDSIKGVDPGNIRSSLESQFSQLMDKYIKDLNYFDELSLFEGLTKEELFEDFCRYCLDEFQFVV